MKTVESMLASDVRERLAGIFDVDVHNSSPDEVLAAARPAMEADARKRERALLDRLAAGVEGGGRAAAGVDEVLEALNEQRVDTLLLDPSFDADAAEAAVESALAQSAAIVTIRGHDDLAARGGIGALLRF
jgi:peptide subunit release factor 1 (eRF1)